MLNRQHKVRSLALPGTRMGEFFFSVVTIKRRTQHIVRDKRLRVADPGILGEPFVLHPTKRTIDP